MSRSDVRPCVRCICAARAPAPPSVRDSHRMEVSLIAARSSALATITGDASASSTLMSSSSRAHPGIADTRMARHECSVAGPHCYSSAGCSTGGARCNERATASDRASGVAGPRSRARRGISQHFQPNRVRSRWPSPAIDCGRGSGGVPARRASCTARRFAGGRPVQISVLAMSLPRGQRLCRSRVYQMCGVGESIRPYRDEGSGGPQGGDCANKARNPWVGPGTAGARRTDPRSPVAASAATATCARGSAPRTGSEPEPTSSR
jgi:hypothetical protein